MDLPAVGAVAAKVLVTPTLILFSVVISRHAGPLLGGAVAGLPFISAPASMFIAHEQGLHFASMAAAGSLVGAIASCGYCLAYALLTRVCGWQVSICSALTVFFGLSYFIQLYMPPLWLLCALSIIIPITCLLLLANTQEQHRKPMHSPRWQLPMQMLCGSLAVVLLTLASHVLGELWSGIMLTFPVISSALIPFAHSSHGRWGAVQIIKGLLMGFVGTSSFIIVVALGLEHLGMLRGYSLAGATALVVSGIFLTAWHSMKTYAD